MVGHCRGVLQPATFFEIGGDACRAGDVVADPPGDAGGQRAPTHDCVRVRLRQRRRAELPGAARNGAKERSLRLGCDDPRLLEVGMQVRFQRGATGHRERPAHAREQKRHEHNQRQIPQTDGCTAAIDGMPTSLHQIRKPPTARAYARRVWRLRIAEARNSTKRTLVRSPATAIEAGKLSAAIAANPVPLVMGMGRLYDEIMQFNEIGIQQVDRTQDPLRLIL